MFQALRINLGLWICCLHDFARTSKIYLQMGAQVDLRYPLDRTPLHIAAANASPDMLKILLEGGADPESSDAEGWNALQHGSFSGSCAIVSLLINHQGVASNEHESDPFTSVCRCSTYRDCSQVRTSVHDTAQVDVWSPLEARSQAVAKAMSHTAKSEVSGNIVTHVSAYASNAQCSLEHEADGSVTLINSECAPKLSATELPLRSKAEAPPSVDAYQDDWLFINEC
jgi:ankyrin repeat protein